MSRNRSVTGRRADRATVPPARGSSVHPSAARPEAERLREAMEARSQQLQHLRATFFDVPLEEKKYTAKQIIGTGASSTVCSAWDENAGQMVAVKRVSNAVETWSLSVRILRELKFLRYLQAHDNIVKIRDILRPAQRDQFKEVFVVFELMPTDLSMLLRSPNNELGPLHIKALMFQLLDGVQYMHSCGVFHRDLKPNNLLIDRGFKLKICDFGLARADFEAEDVAMWTDYVATRWYRAPELIKTHYSRYSTAIDIWSAGCIFGEILSRGVPLFRGRDASNQLEVITDILGSPTPEAIAKVASEKARAELRSMPYKPARKLAELFPRAEPGALRLLRRLLEFDPAKRPTAREALEDSYFDEIRDEIRPKGYQPPEGTPMSPREFEFESMDRHSSNEMRKLFLEEINLYRDRLGGGAQHNDLVEESDNDETTDFNKDMNRLIAGQENTHKSEPKKMFKGFALEWQRKRGIIGGDMESAVRSAMQHATITDQPSNNHSPPTPCN